MPGTEWGMWQSMPFKRSEAWLCVFSLFVALLLDSTICGWFSVLAAGFPLCCCAAVLMEPVLVHAESVG